MTGDEHAHRRHARRSSQRSRGLLAAVHAQSRVQEAPAADLAIEGHALLHAGRPRDHRRHRRALVLQRRPQSPADRRGHSAAGRRTRFLADLPVCASAGVLAGRAPDGDGAGRYRPRVLHQFRLGGLRHRAEDRDRLSQCARAGLAPASDRPRARLSRRRLWRHFGRRHGQQPQILRLAADRRRPSARDLQPRTSSLHEGRAGMGRPSRRRTRADRRPARRVDHRRRDRRADGRLDGRAAGRPRVICRSCARFATNTASFSFSTK